MTGIGIDGGSAAGLATRMALPPVLPAPWDALVEAAAVRRALRQLAADLDSARLPPEALRPKSCPRKP
ncbi:hypothetical protein ACWGCW_04315 [Streptomyces sp. NPDC054933]